MTDIQKQLNEAETLLLIARSYINQCLAKLDHCIDRGIPYREVQCRIEYDCASAIARIFDAQSLLRDVRNLGEED